MAILYFIQEPETLCECVSLISWVQFVMGCSGFFERAGRFVSNKWTRLYSLSFVSLVIYGLSATIYALLQNEVLLERVLQLDKLILCIMAMELLLATLVFLITMISLHSWSQRYVAIYQQLAEIDRRLIGEFGARMNYGKVVRKHIVVLFTVAVLYLGAVNMGLARLADGHHLGIVVPAALCYIVITGGPHLTGFVHMSLAELLGIRFRLLQQILQPQRLQKPQLENVLRSLIDMVKQLHYLIMDINEVYNVTLWSTMAHDFALSTTELYIIFGRSSDMADSSSSGSGIGDGSYGENPDGGEAMGVMLMAFLSICMLVPFYKMLIGPVYCSNSIEEGRKCLHLLEQLDNWFPGNPSIKKLVESIMRWRLQFQINFTSGRSTVYDKTVITVVSGREIVRESKKMRWSPQQSLLIGTKNDCCLSLLLSYFDFSFSIPRLCVTICWCSSHSP